jgi:hypothetical protein
MTFLGESGDAMLKRDFMLDMVELRFLLNLCESCILPNLLLA